MLKQDLFLVKEWTLAHAYFHLWPSISEYRILRDAYSSKSPTIKESKRYYHTWQHIYETCTFVRTHYGFQPEVILALFYHDVVYDVNRKDNEKASAEVWIKYAQNRGLDKTSTHSDKIELIKNLILMTETHKVAEDAPLTYRITCDADMSIFTYPQEAYLEYARNIWREYHGVGRDKFIAGRLQFLNTVRPEDMYYTEQAKKLVDQARQNLELERKVLESEPEKILVEVS